MKTIYIIEVGGCEECEGPTKFVKTDVAPKKMKLFAKMMNMTILGAFESDNSPWWDGEPTIPLEKWIEPVWSWYPQIKFWPGVIEEMPYEFWEEYSKAHYTMHAKNAEPFLDAVRAVLYKKEHSQ